MLYQYDRFVKYLSPELKDIDKNDGSSSSRYWFSNKLFK